MAELCRRGGAPFFACVLSRNETNSSRSMHVLYVYSVQCSVWASMMCQINHMRWYAMLRMCHYCCHYALHYFDPVLKAMVFEVISLGAEVDGVAVECNTINCSLKCVFSFCAYTLAASNPPSNPLTLWAQHILIHGIFFRFDDQTSKISTSISALLLARQRDSNITIFATVQLQMWNGQIEILPWYISQIATNDMAIVRRDPSKWGNNKKKIIHRMANDKRYIIEWIPFFPRNCIIFCCSYRY